MGRIVTSPSRARTRISGLEEEQEGRRVDPAQGAIQLDRGQDERRGEALRQYHLEDIAGLDIVLGAQHHPGVIFGRELRSEFRTVRTEIFQVRSF